MNKKNTDYLFETYWFFGHDKWKGNRREALRYTLMPFGFDCGDGWFRLVDTLCANIEGVFKTLELNAKFGNCDKPDRDMFSVVQVKEKFAGLNFYTGAMNKDVYDRVEGRIAMAEAMSYFICETCGNAGKFRGELMWKKTLCIWCLRRLLLSIAWVNFTYKYYYRPRRVARKWRKHTRSYLHSYWSLASTKVKHLIGYNRTK